MEVELKEEFNKIHEEFGSVYQEIKKVNDEVSLVLKTINSFSIRMDQRMDTMMTKYDVKQYLDDKIGKFASTNKLKIRDEDGQDYAA